MKLEVITIGDELLLGFTVDTNSAHLGQELAQIGVEVVRRTTVRDDAAVIREAVQQALDRTGAVITTGGLGPTSDDLTKPAIAEIFGRGMVFDEEHFAWMARRWRERFGREIPENNRQQAMIPDGCIKLRNNHGSASGIWLEDAQGRWVAMLPGVPREMRGMLADELLPRLRRRAGAGLVVRSRTLRTTGVPESLVAERIATLGDALHDVTLAYLPSAVGVDLRVTVRNVASGEADRRLEHAASALRRVLRNGVYGEDDADLAAVVLDACRARGLTIGVGESCTGGLLGERLTRIPGSSDVFLGGVIAYENSVKTALLDVPAAMLREHGAVSEPVARAMAAGARARTHASIGVGITGVAGPGGGTESKPVGTVWIAVATDTQDRAIQLHLWGDREEVRQRSAQAALEMVRRLLGPEE